jgi:L-asparaginase
MKCLDTKLVSLLLFISLVMVSTAHAQVSSDRPLGKIIATGGTIANSADGRMSVETVLSQIPQLASVARIEVYDFIRIGSSEISIQNWIDIGKVIMQQLQDNPAIDGIVVTHGSNTSEETSYFLNLVLDTNKPVVIVGAQRQRSALSEDGSRNLFDAVRVAASPEAAGRGVMLVAGDMVHAARDVTKTMSYRTETWNSGDLGVLGLTDPDRIRFYRMPYGRHTSTSEFRLDGIEKAADLPRVDILYVYADAGPELVNAAVAAGAKGIIVAGFATGSASPAMEKALEAVRARGIAVIMSHRGGKGRVQTGRGFTSADNLTPQKARILLMLALAHKIPADRLEQLFMDY